jgi:hypothetical protein
VAGVSDHLTLVVVPVVGPMQVAVMRIVDVITVRHRNVATAVAVHMVVDPDVLDVSGCQQYPTPHTLAHRLSLHPATCAITPLAFIRHHQPAKQGRRSPDRGADVPPGTENMRTVDSGTPDSIVPSNNGEGGDSHMDMTGFGIVGTLVVVIGYLLLANHRDRTTYQRAIRDRDAEHAAELAAARTAHNEDLNGLRARLSSLEKRLAELETELDHERDLRRIAQDVAAAARRRL